MAHRIDRINESVARELTDILRGVKDPRVSSAFISITGVEVSADLSVAKVHYSVLGRSDPDLYKGLVSASGYIRGELASRLDMRNTPKLTFIKDDTAEKAMKIADILKSTTYSTEPNGENGETDEKH